MKLIIYVNSNFEDERALFDLDELKVLIHGDYYHDKIDEKIAGYLEALDDFGIYKEDVEEEWIDETHEHRDLIEFYG